MDILIMGGFLGSGKTTIIKQLIRGLVNDGKTCAVIENEIGDVGIDDVLIGEAGLTVTPLFGGCVCCQITGDLMTAVHRIQDEISPDWVVVEMTGLALMDSIRDTFEEYGGPGFKIHTVSVVDMSRWIHLMGALAVVFDNQVEGADVVFLNKTDVAAPVPETYEIIGQKAPGAVISCLDAAKKEPGPLWAELLRCIGEHEGGMKK
ncbi:MAG: cobalamin biosynthesis protein P47K [Peptococcaceae bacterium]|jgi:G3E family GTPase|nr:cobalamin biosynthesis protein P47K [Peptococcaceae bacterium]